MEEQCSRRVKLIKISFRIYFFIHKYFFVFRKNKNSGSQNRRPGGGNKKANDTVEYFG